MTNSLPKINQYFWIVVRYVLSAVLFQFIILFWFGFSLKTSIIDSSISIGLLTAGGLLMANNLKYYRPEKNRYLYMLIWCLILSAIWIFTSQWILSYLLIAEANYDDFLYKSVPVRFFIGLLIIGLTALLSLLWYTQQDQKEIEQRKADAEKLARDAELYNLRQQLQPHFLFNSLNSITALIGSRPEEARKMVHKLSDFLRGTLKKEDQEPISLSEELEHLQLYLDIEMVRFGHRLTTEVNSDEQCNKLLIPPMILQPIVENAIKFGLYDTIGIVKIEIKVECIHNELHVTVQNPYDPDTTRPKRGTGFGLSGVKRRLHLLFGRIDLLETKSDNHIFTSIVKIPQ